MNSMVVVDSTKPAKAALPDPIVRTIVGIPSTGRISRRNQLTIDGCLHEFETSESAFAVWAVESSDLPPVADDFQESAKRIAEWSQLRVPPHAVVMQAETLCASLGDPEWDESTTTIEFACQECKGKGRVPHDCNCDHCDEAWEDCGCKNPKETEEVTERLSAEIRHVILAGAQINANLLACALHVAGATGECRVWTGTSEKGGPHDPVYVAGGTWRVGLMQLVAYSDEDRAIWAKAPRIGCP